jgi:hypothetical protein
MRPLPPLAIRTLLLHAYTCVLGMEGRHTPLYLILPQVNSTIQRSVWSLQPQSPLTLSARTSCRMQVRRPRDHAGSWVLETGWTGRLPATASSPGDRARGRGGWRPVIKGPQHVRVDPEPGAPLRPSRPSVRRCGGRDLVELRLRLVLRSGCTAVHSLALRRICRLPLGGHPDEGEPRTRPARGWKLSEFTQESSLVSPRAGKRSDTVRWHQVLITAVGLMAGLLSVICNSLVLEYWGAGLGLWWAIACCGILSLLRGNTTSDKVRQADLSPR